MVINIGDSIWVKLASGQTQIQKAFYLANKSTPPRLLQKSHICITPIKSPVFSTASTAQWP